MENSYPGRSASRVEKIARNLAGLLRALTVLRSSGTSHAAFLHARFRHLQEVFHALRTRQCRFAYR